jgi:acetoacetyl-CoA synthetase
LPDSIVQLRPARAADADAVCRLLAAEMGRGLTAAQYKRLFEYPWLEDKPDFGHLLEENGEVVGFLGAIYADRAADGQTRRTCNLSSWCVKESHRNHSIKLIMAVLKDRSLLYTNFSPTPPVEKVLRGLGFRLLSTNKLFFPLGFQFWTLPRSWGAKFLLGAGQILPELDPAQAKLCRDHAQTGCGHLGLFAGGRFCYVIWKRRIKRSLVFSELLYVSDPDLLLRHLEAVKLRICWHDGSPAMAVDDRLLPFRPAGAVPYRRVTMFRQAGQEPAPVIDNLYSELVLL